MAKTAMIRARTEPKLKGEVEKIFHALGLSSTEAINLFFRQVELHKGLPFDIKIPTKTTLAAIRDVKKQRNLRKSKDKKDMFKKLGI